MSDTSRANRGHNNKLTISPVRGKADMKKFVELPWQIYQNDPNWIPPLKSSVSKLLNRNKHPFWHFSEGELFLAARGQEIVGRILAVVDKNSNTYHNETMGTWGFFECFQDHEASSELFSAAEEWVLDKGMSGIRGPLNPSTNYEVGLLVDGFDKIPALMMNYNPSYYLELVYGAGYRKEQDLFSYRITKEHELPEWMFSLAERVCRNDDVEIRCPKKWKREDIRLLCQVYRECWGDNWGFVPTTEEEEDELAKELLFILEPELAFFLYYKQEAVGIGVMLPDFNPLLKRFNGNLGISALVKKFMYQSEIVGLRGLLFGVKPGFRQMGLPMVSVKYVLDVLKKMDKYSYAEMGWTLEKNESINRLFAESGFLPDKRYRIYRKDFS